MADDGDSGRAARLLDGSAILPNLSGFKTFLNVMRDESGSIRFVQDGGLSFPLATGARWGRIGTAIIGSVVAATTIGGVSIIQGIERAVTSVLAALGGGYQLLIREYVEVPIAALRGAFAFTVNEFGTLALPISVAVVLLTLYIVSQGIDRIREVLS